MLVTTTLKMRKGSRYVALMVSNWTITVFAAPIASTVAPTGPEMGLIMDDFSCATAISLPMV